MSVGEPRGNARGREPRPRSTPAGPDSCFVNEGWGFGSGPCIIACPPVLLRRGGVASDWRNVIQKDLISFGIRSNRIDLMSFEIRLNLRIFVI